MSRDYGRPYERRRDRPDRPDREDREDRSRDRGFRRDRSERGYESHGRSSDRGYEGHGRGGYEGHGRGGYESHGRGGYESHGRGGYDRPRFDPRERSGDRYERYDRYERPERQERYDRGPPPPPPPPSSSYQSDNQNYGRARGRGRTPYHDQPGSSMGIRPTMREVTYPSIQPPPPPASIASCSSSVAMDTESVYANPITGRGASRSNRGPREKPEPLVHTRPEQVANSKKGNAGEPIVILSNYFHMETLPTWKLYQYSVVVEPTQENVAVRRKCIRDQKEHIGGYLFDGNMLFVTYKLDPDPWVFHAKREDGTDLVVTVKHTSNIEHGDYMYFQVFNLIMRKCYNGLKLQVMGRDFYDVKSKVDIPQYKLQIWPGYKTTIMQREKSIMMVAEITHKVVRLDSVYDFYMFCTQQNGTDYFSSFKNGVLGQTVLTDYNNRTYQVSDVDFECTPRSTFPMNGENVTYIEYYQRKYQQRIRDPNQPMLITKAKERDIRRGCSEVVYLVPEFCRMTGLTPKMKADFGLMKALAQHTCVAPGVRIRKLLNLNQRLCSEPECIREMKNWRMKLNSRLAEIPARILPMEKIRQYGDINYPAGDRNDGWNKELRSNRMAHNCNVTKWAVIVPQYLFRNAMNFVDMIMRNAKGMELMLPKPLTFQLQSENVPVYMNQLEEVISQHNPNIILCILGRGDQLYSQIKRKCSVDRATVTQVVLSKTINNRNAMTIATKVAIQMNCKMGGSPWTVSNPLPKSMVIGYDVCHDPRDKSISYGAMVASLDTDHSRYYSTITKHTNGEELASEFGINIKKALYEYSKMNGSYPTHVFIYRDGVGEGQISFVYKLEVETIKKSLSEIYGADPYKLSFILVTKRLNTRFFHNENNPKPGTVVDDIVTSPERYDFYLISQAVRNGTVAPTSYNVIFDNTGLSPDRLQILTFKQCHLYFNLSATIRVPAVCNYAHKLAFLVSQSLKTAPNPVLNNVLHYI